MYKTFLAGGAVLFAAFALQPAAAKADTEISIGVGDGRAPVQYYRDYPVYDPGYSDYDDDDDYDEDYLSCSEGRRLVRQEGFRQVRATRCGSEIYRYQAVKRYRLWSVKVSARSGRIISARVIGNYGDYY